jgi:hypothetical protein
MDKEITSGPLMKVVETTKFHYEKSQGGSFPCNAIKLQGKHKNRAGGHK